MINSVSLFDLMVAGLLPISWAKLSIAHGLNVLFFSGSILHVKYVGYDCGFDLGDSSSPARIVRALRLPTLQSPCIFLFTRCFISTSQLLLPAMFPFPHFVHFDSFGYLFVLSLVWSSPQFQQTAFCRNLAFACPYLWHLGHIIGQSLYLYTAVSNGESMAVLAK